MLLRVLAGIIVLIIGGSNAASAVDDFSFKNQYWYIDESKILRLFGEVTNESAEPVEDILITALFYDADGKPLGEYKRSAEFQYLVPGQSSPFEILFLDQDASAAVSNFTLSANASVASGPREQELEIVSSNSRLDVLGTFYINAVARNNGPEMATNTVMIATLYDAEGRVIAIGRALAEAVRGTADIPSDSEGPFGFAVTDKLQTYKTSRYSLAVQSDQYTSDTKLFAVSGQGSASGNQTQSGCLIATAAFGSDFAPQVQLLREFRDKIAMQTFAGSSFMRTFNAWYYSFSPAVAEYERQSPPAREAVRFLIQPLLLILNASTALHSALLSQGVNTEGAVVATGMAASSLIGLTYLLPAAAVLGIMKKRILGSALAKVGLFSCWGVSTGLTISAFVSSSDQLMGIATSGLVLCCISTAVILLGDRFSKL